jgi:hypothetical protein
MKTKFLLFATLLVFCAPVFATTNKTVSIDVSALNAEKEYLAMINQCANPKLYSKILESALDTKNQDKRTAFAAQIEETIINNPACFVTTMTKLGYKKCTAVKETFIQEPYFYPKHDIYRALRTASNFADSCFAS